MHAFLLSVTYRLICSLIDMLCPFIANYLHAMARNSVDLLLCFAGPFVIQTWMLLLASVR